MAKSPLTQEGRPMAIHTPLGKDVLYLAGFSGREAISQLFHFKFDMVAENNKEVPFEKLLGEMVTIEVETEPGKKRHFSGVVNRMSETGRDDDFAYFQAEFVPQFWLLTKRIQSRIFQHLSVPDILKKVLEGLDTAFEIQGTFQPRDFCVQYRESDFAFASRLMEEEGIFYFFKHTDSGHKMVLANTPQSHPDLPGGSKILFSEAVGKELGNNQVLNWQKVQELRSGKVTLFDHCFELPHKHLEASQAIKDSVQVGGVSHKLKVGNNAKLEIYDYPGGYAQRFDGIDKGGGEKPADLQKIFEDNKRTAGIRMEQEALHSLTIMGSSLSGNFTSGHKFTLEGHPKGDGAYVVTSVQHVASQAGLRSGGSGYSYHNSFTCIPAELPFRPQRVTPRPFVRGSQTAVVVGPAGEEIFCDKYGRVKIQFHWDRHGKYDADSSCWVRVSTLWAGKKWGITNVPRIGHEVIVDFIEGDPDQPIIIGSVHNADHMPTGELPKEKMVSGLRSSSTPGGSGFNGLTFNDTKGKEMIKLHAQYDMDTEIEHNDTQHVKVDRKIQVDGTHTESIDKNTTIAILTGNLSHDVKTGTAHYHVKGAVTEKFETSQETIVKNGIHIASETAHIYIHTATSIQLHVGDSSIWMDSGGKIHLKGNNIVIEGKQTVTVLGGHITEIADNTHEIHGKDVKSEAAGNNVVKGSMVMLNP